MQKCLDNLSRVVRIPSHKTKTEAFSIKSIHTPVGDEENKESWGDRHLEAEAAPSRRDIDDLRADLQRALGRIPEKQREAVTRFYGIDREYAQSADQIGVELNLTAERVRQILRKAEAAIKAQPGSELMLQYL
jgi:DNA-directed RNA polymerase sigma subunit (sigma70/sigma32)